MMVLVPSCSGFAAGRAPLLALHVVVGHIAQRLTHLDVKPRANFRRAGECLVRSGDHAAGVREVLPDDLYPGLVARTRGVA